MKDCLVCNCLFLKKINYVACINTEKCEKFNNFNNKEKIEIYRETQKPYNSNKDCLDQKEKCPKRKKNKTLAQ